MSSCSTTPLTAKLGIKEGARVAVAGGPASLSAALRPLPPRAVVRRSIPASGPSDIVIGFATDRGQLDRDFDRWAAAIPPDGAVWVAWPKKASGVATDLTENVVRDVALSRGLVDVKVCAIDETWSGLKIVVRTKDRPKARKRPRRTATSGT